MVMMIMKMICRVINTTIMMKIMTTRIMMMMMIIMKINDNDDYCNVYYLITKNIFVSSGAILFCFQAVSFVLHQNET